MTSLDLLVKAAKYTPRFVFFDNIKTMAPEILW